MYIKNKKLIALALAASMVTACGGGGDDDDDNPGGGSFDSTTDLEKAKAFVDDMRNLKLLFTEDLANEQGTGSAQQFIDSFDAVADSVGGRDYSNALEVIADTTAHFVESIGDGDNSSTETETFQAAYNRYLVAEGESDAGLIISGTISYNTATNTVTINAEVGDVEAKLTIDVTDDGTVTQADTTISGTMVSMSNPDDKITIRPGSTISYVLTNQKEVSFGSTIEEGEISEISFNFDAQVATSNNNEITTFDGRLYFDLVKPTAELAAYEDIDLLAPNFGMSGELNVGSQSFEVSFDANFTNAATFNWAIEDEEGPDSDNWANADFSLTFETDFNNDDVTITWSADRDAYNTATSSLSFAFGSGTTIVARADAERTQIVEDGDDIFEGSFTITHNSGAQAVFDEDNEKFDIIVNGSDEGDIEEVEDDMIKATFSDGTFVTL